MSGVLAIARATFTEARRNKIVWSLLFFCIFLVLTSFLLQTVTITAFDRIVRDFGIAAINVFGVLLGIFLGVGVVGRDIDRRIVYVIVGKPVSRFEYLLGRALGIWAAVALSLVLMAIALIVETLFYNGPIRLIIFEGLALILVEVFVIVSIAVMASSAMGTMVAAFVTLSAFIIGHFSQDIYFAGRRSEVQAVKSLAAAIYYALPDLERLNLKSEVSTLTAVPLSRVVASAGYGLLYAGLFLTLAAFVFSRRDLK